MVRVLGSFLVLVFCCFGQVYGQDVQELLTSFEIAQKDQNRSKYDSTKEQLLIVVKKKSLEESEIDRFIIVARSFRDIALTTRLFELKHDLHAHEKGEECTCGKHKHCHE